MKCTKYLILFTLFLVALLAACTPASASVVMVTSTPDPMRTPEIVMVTATPNPTSTPDPEVTVYYEGYAQFELISSWGRRILMDVHNPDLLSSPPTEDDILLTTHRHGDHYLASFVSSFPGPQMLSQVGRINAPDVSIQGIASAHSAREIPVPNGGSNYIYVIDMAGMRFAHFGDIGQQELSQEQLDALGDVDVAMILIGGMCSAADGNSFNLLEQVQPRLVIPTHADIESLERGIETWDAYYGDPWASPSEITGVSIEPVDLSDETKFLMLGEWAVACKEGYDLTEWQ
jgi:L-ascorbate metabolism protein UlaG (beta-lactamase superfamily)